MLQRLRACSRSQELNSLAPPLKEPSPVGLPSRNSSLFIRMRKALILFSRRQVCWPGQPLLIQQRQMWKTQYLWRSCILQLGRKKKYTLLDQQKARNMLPLSVKSFQMVRLDVLSQQRLLWWQLHQRAHRQWKPNSVYPVMNFRIQEWWRGQQQPVHQTAAASELENSPAQGHISNIFHHGRVYACLLQSTDDFSGTVQTQSHGWWIVLPWSRAQWSPDIRSREGGWVLIVIMEMFACGMGQWRACGWQQTSLDPVLLLLGSWVGGAWQSPWNF